MTKNGTGRYRLRNSAEAREFSPQCLNRLCNPDILLFNGCRVYFPGIKEPGREADCLGPLVPWLRMSGATSLVGPHAVNRDKSKLFLTSSVELCLGSLTTTLNFLTYRTVR